MSKNYIIGAVIGVASLMLASLFLFWARGYVYPAWAYAVFAIVVGFYGARIWGR